MEGQLIGHTEHAQAGFCPKKNGFLLGLANPWWKALELWQVGANSAGIKALGAAVLPETGLLGTAPGQCANYKFEVEGLA
jgi:hypothetical protein